MEKLFFFILVLTSSCLFKSKNNLSYFVINKYSNNFISPPTKFISYENYLFEFKNEQVTNNYKDSIVNITNNNKVFVFKKNSEKVFLLNNFESNFEVLKSFLKKDISDGIILKQKDSLILSIYKNFSTLNKTNTKIKSNELLSVEKVIDSINNKKAIFIFIKNDKLNTIFNILDPENEKLIMPFTFYGYQLQNTGKNIMEFRCDSFVNISNAERNICEKIVNKLVF